MLGGEGGGADACATPITARLDAGACVALKVGAAAAAVWRSCGLAETARARGGGRANATRVLGIYRSNGSLEDADPAIR